MDPITLVVTALVAGLSAGLTESARGTIKDAYDSLRARLQTAASANPEAAQALESVEKKPDSPARQAVLKEELQGLEVASNQEILALARQVLETLDKEGARQGKYNITIQNSSGIAIGDGAQVHLTPKEKRS